MKEVVEPGRPQGKGENHTGHRHRGGLHPHGHQLIEFTFQAGQEQEGIKPDLRDRLEVVEGFVVDLPGVLGGDGREGRHEVEQGVVDLSVKLGGNDQVQP